MMPSPPRRIIGVTCAVFLLLLAILAAVARYGEPSFVACRVETDGSFVALESARGDGKRGGGPTWAFTPDGRFERGRIRIGPFPAPAHLNVSISGGSAAPGGTLNLEMEGIGFVLPLQLKAPSQPLHVEHFDLPFGWRGRLVTLIVTANATDGPVTVSPPLQPAGEQFFGFGLAAALGSFALNGVLLLFGFWCAASMLSRLACVPEWWVPLGAAAVVAVLAYGAFWAYFVSPVLGKLYSGAFVGLSILAWLRLTPRDRVQSHEWPRVLGLTALIGCFYLSVLYFFGPHRDFYDLAANRFVSNLPGDNRLPHDIGVLIYHGLSPKGPGGDWLSSDRPPLQTGWQLLTWPVTRAFGFAETTASATSAVWLQLLWVPAAYGLLRTLGISTARSGGWIGLISLTGFCLLNTVFTWPKMGAGAFGCGAFGLWFLGPAGGKPSLRYALAGVFAVLALLSHGAAAFAFIGLVPAVIANFLKGNFKRWIISGVVVAVLMAPWIWYQKIYEPPANRLVKWHLGGQVAVDARPAWQTIREAYARLSAQQIAERKLGNLRMVMEGDWASLVSFRAAKAEMRRLDEFNHVGLAFGGWLVLGVIFGVRSLLKSGKRRPTTSSTEAELRLAGWTVATLVVWCLLLYERAAVIFLGAYSLMIAGYCLLSRRLDGTAGFFLLAIFQLGYFATTWLPASARVSGPLYLPAAIVALLTAVLIGATIFEGFRSERRLLSRPAAPPLLV